MLVSFDQNLTVTENYNLGRYGEFWLSSGGRLFTPTNIVPPGSEAITLQNKNDLNRILVDDFSTKQNPDPVIYPAPQLDAFNTLRSGSIVNSLTGVLHYAFNNYRVQPTQDFEINTVNPRELKPAELSGSLKVASFNLLNYFNGDGKGNGFPTSRGADNLEEFQRQQDKLVEALTQMDADIIGVMEIENDGFDEYSSIASIVNAINDEIGYQRYNFVKPSVSKIGSDAIAVGLIYDQLTVALKGTAAILDKTVDARFEDSKNRPVLAQSFKEIASGGVLTISVNHLKSKGSSCDSLGDPDIGDGQANCNLTRTAAAQALVDWLDTNPTGVKDGDNLIIGDLNSYAKEDPIEAIKAKDYVDLIAKFNRAPYSYVFFGQAGYLDHALASASLTQQVSGVTEWHINADEPKVLDYNTEFKTDNQVITYYDKSAYRSSDHDPILIGLDLVSDTVSANSIFVKSMKSQESLFNRTYKRRNREYVVEQLSISVSIKVENDLKEPVQGATVVGNWEFSNNQRQASCVTDENGVCNVAITTRNGSQPIGLVINMINSEALSYASEKNKLDSLKF